MLYNTSGIYYQKGIRDAFKDHLQAFFLFISHFYYLLQFKRHIVEVFCNLIEFASSAQKKSSLKPPLCNRPGEFIDLKDKPPDMFNLPCCY